MNIEQVPAFRIPVRKADLDNLTEEERNLMFFLGQFMNDLRFLLRFGAFLQRAPHHPDARRVQMGMFMTVSRILAAKLYEGWKFIRKDLLERREGVRITLPESAETAAESLSEIMDRADVKVGRGKKLNIIMFLRNSEFHYDKTANSKVWDAVPTDFVAFEYDGPNGFAGVAEYMVDSRLRTLLSIETDEEARREVYNRLFEVVEYLQQITVDAYRELLQLAGVERERVEELSIPSIPFNDVFIPYFVNKPPEESEV